MRAEAIKRPDDEIARLPANTLHSLDITDRMSPELRACVHEFGSAIVTACGQAGVTKPSHIRMLVHSIWAGARQPHQRAGKKGGNHSPVLDHLDWILIQGGAAISAATLLRILWHHGMVVVPREPMRAMIDASMAAVTAGMPVVSKQEKHTRRLRAALQGAALKLWPHLAGDRP